MVSLESDHSTSISTEPISSPRISFSSDFLDDINFISITPKAEIRRNHDTEQEKLRNVDFEFFSSNAPSDSLLTADELFFEGKLLPFWSIHHAEKLNKISLKPKELEMENEEDKKKKEGEENKEDSRISWFMDDDPSPRPPKCTVLWKELLGLRKQRGSSLSPSLSTSSSSSSYSSGSIADMCSINDGKEGKEKSLNREKHVKRIKKEVERTRSASVRIRPIVHVPPCTQAKTTAFPPLFTLKKGRVVR
ncbi:uncharacterized protein LOC122074243 [Macadamia integrifolia]|uniref:uncharacterized protein LOC122074243 n=1 Tax=Macadamia integrifolia TaxID=60698 RepID=UPI001C4F2F56|nr:uncharacterized protein LOC122074243 [Macadamia integrifolia]